MFPDFLWLETLLYAVVVTVVAAAYIRDYRSSDPDPVEQAREQYASGDIDSQEFERRLEFHLDDRNDRIRVVVEDVNGVGEATSKAIAHEFESVAALRGADRERLEGVAGVGEQTSEAVLERVRE